MAVSASRCGSAKVKSMASQNWFLLASAARRRDKVLPNPLELHVAAMENVSDFVNFKS
jgi:hypothetical protein